jgi:hypothetical protein
MPTYAAIPVNRNTIMEIFAHVVDVPDGHSRLAWALFKFPYNEEDYFFIGGNYLGMSGPPDFGRQILPKAKLNEWFDYNVKAMERRNGPRQNGSWFPVSVKDGIIFRGPRNRTREEQPA